MRTKDDIKIQKKEDEKYEHRSRRKIERTKHSNIYVRSI
jgi:hypothetical protein